MSEPIVCPDCGHRNAPEATSCEHCNFPLVGAPGSESRAAAGDDATASHEQAAPGGAEAAAPSRAETPPILIRRPLRRPPRQRMPNQLISLWILFGAFAAMSLVWLAIKVNVDRQQQPVEGAREDQQRRADAARALLAKDSTNVQAHVALADVLYDTGNWSEAIVHYRAAVRRDSSLATALVDQGVCYYNLGDASTAERCFLLALERDPHQPIALFNLGIVNERRENYETALKYFHRAMESSPPADMQQPLIDEIKHIQEKTGKPAPPLPQS